MLYPYSLAWCAELALCHVQGSLKMEDMHRHGTLQQGAYDHSKDR